MARLNDGWGGGSFDINDLDETLPAPWEWDLKRLAAEVSVLACRNNGFSQGDARDAVLACVRSYRERMAEYSDLPVLEVWYASIDIDKFRMSKSKTRTPSGKPVNGLPLPAHATCWNTIFPKLAAGAGRSAHHQGQSPPLIYHLMVARRRKICSRAPAKPTPVIGKRCRGRPAGASRPV